MKLAQKSEKQVLKAVKQANSSYLLRSDRKSYIGFTNDIKNRLRCHRGIIKKGARYTSSWKQIHLVCYVSGFETKNLALSYEWYAKRKYYLKNKKLKKFTTLYSSCKKIHWRLALFLWPLFFEKFKDQQLTLYVPQENLECIRSIYCLVSKDNLDIKPIPDDIQIRYFK